MHRVFLVATLVLVCTGSLCAQTHGALAPADEYFGRMKMSILGIRNALRDETAKVTGDPRHASAQLASCRWVEDAIEDWGRKYPHDTWLPTSIASLERVYVSIHTTRARTEAARLGAWARRRYR